MWVGGAGNWLVKSLQTDRGGPERRHRGRWSMGTEFITTETKTKMSDELIVRPVILVSTDLTAHTPAVLFLAGDRHHLYAPGNNSLPLMRSLKSFFPSFRHQLLILQNEISHVKRPSFFCPPFASTPPPPSPKPSPPSLCSLFCLYTDGRSS